MIRCGKKDFSKFPNIPMKKMISQITPKHMLDNKILLKLEKIFNSIEINPNSTYPLSELSVHGSSITQKGHSPPPPKPLESLLVQNVGVGWAMPITSSMLCTSTMGDEVVATCDGIVRCN